jgi:outer membrane protein
MAAVRLWRTDRSFECREAGFRHRQHHLYRGSSAGGLQGVLQLRRGALRARHWSRVEVAQARQATAQAQLAQVRAAGKGEDAYGALTAAMSVSPLSHVRIAEIAHRHLSAAMLEPIDRIVSEAFARRPDVSGAYAAHEASPKKLCAAKAEFMPKRFLSGTGSYTSGRAARTTMTSGLSADCDIQSGSYRPGGGICA